MGDAHRDQLAMVPAAPNDDHASMFKRFVAATLWFLATMTAYSFAAVLLDAPRVIGPIVGLVAALLVGLDPAGLLWEPRVQRVSTRPAGISHGSVSGIVAQD
jgi:hypothetical protein